MNENVVERDVFGADEEVGPAGRVELSDSFDRDAGGVLCDEEDGPIVLVVGILDSSVRLPAEASTAPGILTRISCPANSLYQRCPFPFRIPEPKILMS
jgi:hypothetical protein